MSDFSNSPERKSPHLSTRVTLTRDLSNLKDKVERLGGLSSEILALCISGVSIPEKFLVDRIPDLCVKSEEIAQNIEKYAFTILSLQQPLLKDLRFVIGSLKISSEFMKISTSAKELVNAIFESLPDTKTRPELISLLETLGGKFQDALFALSENSSELANKTFSGMLENELNFDSLFRSIVKICCTKPEETSVSLKSVLLTRQMGDSILSILKEIYFMSSGERL